LDVSVNLFLLSDFYFEIKASYSMRFCVLSSILMNPYLPIETPLPKFRKQPLFPMIKIHPVYAKSMQNPFRMNSFCYREIPKKIRIGKSEIRLRLKTIKYSENLICYEKIGYFCQTLYP